MKTELQESIDKQLETATEELSLIQKQVELEGTRRQLDHMRGIHHVQESWYEIPGDERRTDYGLSPRNLRFPYSRIYDRREGRLLPIYETEQDLQRIRATSRNIAAFSSTAWGALSVLQTYNIGTGYLYEAKSSERFKNDETVQSLASAVQDFIHEFVDENSFSPSVANAMGNTSPPLENELDRRTREDGEAFMWVYEDRSGHARVRFAEPEQITEPPARVAPDIDHWIGCDGPCNWKFGVHTGYNANLRDFEEDRPLGYHVLFDEGTGDFEYVPTNIGEGARVEVGAMVHARRNVIRSAKRGVPDFFWIAQKLEKLEKLWERTMDGAAIQASIAFIRSWGKQAPPTLGGAPTSSNADATSWTEQKLSGGGTRTVSREHFHSGKVIDLYGEHAQYHAGPMGTLRSPVFIEVAQFTLRLLSRIWVIPEDVISGDASNNNLASIQEAHSPFRKARDKDQADLAGPLLSVIWKAIRIAHRSARFDRLTGGHVPWREFVRILDITATAPDVVQRNTLEQAQENVILVDMGAKSVSTFQREIGLDPEEEQRDGARPKSVGGEVNPALQAAVEGVLESDDSVEGRRAMVRDLAGV